MNCFSAEDSERTSLSKISSSGALFTFSFARNFCWKHLISTQPFISESSFLRAIGFTKIARMSKIVDGRRKTLHILIGGSHPDHLNPISTRSELIKSIPIHQYIAAAGEIFYYYELLLCVHLSWLVLSCSQQKS